MTRAEYTSKGKPKTGFESSVVANPEGAAYASSGLVILDFFFQYDYDNSYFDYFV